MRLRVKSRPSGLVSLLAVAICGSATIALIMIASSRWHVSRSPAEKYTLTQVRRADLFPSLTSGGRVESSKKTVIECELENITIGIQGQRVTAGGGSVLISVIPEGSMVKQGDVLAVLDSSGYEELLRQQKMTVERSRADYEQARLNLEIAKMSIREYQEGLKGETLKEFKRNLAMKRSDVARIGDRLSWTRRMKKKGYVPAAQLSSEEFNQSVAAFSLAQENTAFELYNKWTAPKILKVLDGQVLTAETTLNFQLIRLNRNVERLTKLEKQVDLCTIKAPHDGFVIYADDERRDLQIEAGMSVRQKQDLFFLPDLTDMEVVALLHESIVDGVEKGMRAKVQVEGLPDRKLEGHVTSIAQLPTMNWRSDVRYFEGTVKLDNPPAGLKPGMSAEVEIRMNRRENVLAVPAEAVTSEDGRDICYVAHEDGLERREIKLGTVTRDLFEVSKGLSEGEQVVMNPPRREVEQDVTETSPLAFEGSHMDGEKDDQNGRMVAALR